jgi:hypothetical protein
VSFRSKPTGWRYESYRHALAAKGVSTVTNNTYMYRKYPGSAAIGRSGPGTLAGGLRNALADKERRIYSDPIKLREQLRGRERVSEQMATRGLSNDEQLLLEHEKIIALSPANVQGRFFVLSPKWLRIEQEAVKGIEKIRENNGDLLRGKGNKNTRTEVAELKSELRRLRKGKEYREAVDNLNKYKYPLNMRLDEKAQNNIKWADKVLSGRTTTRDKVEK